MNVKITYEDGTIKDLYLDKRFSLVGVNGDRYSIMSYTADTMKLVGYSKKEIEEYLGGVLREGSNTVIRISSDMIDECNRKVGFSVKPVLARDDYYENSSF